MFDVIGTKAQHFVKNGSRHCPEAVAAHLLFADSHASHGGKYGVVTHWSCVAACTWEDIATLASEGLQFAQDFHCLAGEGAGSLIGFGANKGVFVTTSSFSKHAYDYAENVPQRIILIDGEKLTSLMLEHNVGVRINQNIELKRVDEDFFTD